MAGQQFHPAFELQIREHGLEFGGSQVAAPQHLVNRYWRQSNQFNDFGGPFRGRAERVRGDFRDFRPPRGHPGGVEEGGFPGRFGEVLKSVMLCFGAQRPRRCTLRRFKYAG